MTDHDLAWLNAQRPQPLGGEQTAHDRALDALARHTAARRSPGFLRLAGLFRPRAFGVAAAAGGAVIVAALVLSSGGTAGRTQPGHRAAGQQGGVAAHAGSGSPLMRLSDYVSASEAPAGDATLVSRTTSTGDRTVTVYDLYADDGQYFFSPEEKGLQKQVETHHNLAGELYANEIAAAEEAVTGSVQSAAQDMADAPDPSQVIPRTEAPADAAAVREKLQAMGAGSTGQDAEVQGSRFDNWAWEDSQDALIAGSGNPQVRAGVLRILATLPDVTVTHGTAGGQPTLVLTAGADELMPGYSEQLTINAESGVPIQFVGGPNGGAPSTTVDYEVSRVSLASLPTAAGGETGAGHS